MNRYTYVAKDALGKRVKGELQAKDQTVVAEILKRKKLTPVTVSQKKEKKASTFAFGKVPLSEVVIFSRQLATMIGAGIPVLQALEIVSEQTDHVKFKQVLADVARRVASGQSIFKSMVQHEKVFTEFFVHIIKAGEESGNLDEILDRVAVYLEKTDQIIRKVKSAMIYPIIVMSMALAITVLMLVKVIPVFVEMYEGFSIDLPAPTAMLIQTSDFLRNNLLWIGMGAVFFTFCFKKYAASTKGNLVVDRMKLHLPIFGIVLRKVAVSKFTRTLGTLLKSGVPILRAMDIVAKTSGNKVIEKAIMESSRSIREGRKISEPLEEANVFPPMVIRMIAVGEESGEIERMLEKISDFYDDQVDAAVSGLTSMIEPLVIAFLGIVIGGIVISMFMPMFQMVNAIN